LLAKRKNMKEETFRSMRRCKQQLTDEESKNILSKMTSGVLALQGNNGYPYTVPISYIFHEDKLYFHSAISGHKIEAIRNCNKASFCVIAQDDIIAEKYSPTQSKTSTLHEITSSLNAVMVLCFNIEHLTGKQALGLVKKEL